MARLGAILLVWSFAAAAVANSSEYALKATLLKKVMTFVEWPEPSQASTICIVGTDPFGPYLNDVFSAPDTTIRRLDREHGDTDGCTLVWLSDTEAGTFETVLEALAEAPVLTISDLPRFCSRGGMINLRLVNRRVRFVVNPAALESANLRISHKLLRLAEIAETETSR